MKLEFGDDVGLIDDRAVSSCSVLVMLRFCDNENEAGDDGDE